MPYLFFFRRGKVIFDVERLAYFFRRFTLDHVRYSLASNI